MTRPFLVALTVAWAAIQAAGPAQPVKLSKVAAEAVTKEIEKGRLGAQTFLRSGQTSYLAAIERKDFADRKTLTVGRGADNDVRIDSPDVAPHHLRITLDGDRFRVEAVDAAAGFKIKDQDMRTAVVGPSSVQVGRFTLRLSHQRFPAIIVFDPRSPRFKEYKGLKYYPVDLSYRFELPLTPNPKPEEIVVMSTLGHQRRALRIGWFEFVVAGTAHRLEATRLLEPGVGEEDVSVFFRDATTGRDTYSVGRYLDVRKLPDGNYLLDFNLAYNPACAYSPLYNCPLPPRANALKVAIRAGEMDSGYSTTKYASE